MGQNGDTEFIPLLIHPGSLSLERTSCEHPRKHKLHCGCGCGCGTDLWVPYSACSALDWHVRGPMRLRVGGPLGVLVTAKGLIGNESAPCA